MLQRVVILLLFLLGIIAGCKKSSPAPTAGVPNVAVNFTDDIYSAGYAPLLSSGGYVYIAYTGYDGLILFCNSPTPTFLAFDRGCPYDCETNTKAIINVQAGGITAVCPVCGTTYNLYNGTINKGPGTIALKQYYTIYTDPYLTVSSSP